MSPSLFTKKILPFLFILICSTLLGPLYALSSEPHGAPNPKCDACHIGHTALGGYLLTKPTERETCYVCHDGSETVYGTVYNIRKQFGETTVGTSVYKTVYSAVYGSHHPVPEGTLVCTSCHDPHRQAPTYPRLLGPRTNHAATGIEVCGACHGPGSSYKGGDIVSTYAYGHNSAKMNPSSGTQVKCAMCHEPHGSALPDLLRSLITDPNGAQHTANGNNNSVCAACHTNAKDNYSGYNIYTQTKHGSVNTSVYAATYWPGTNYTPTQCLNCHDPHGKTGEKNYKRAASNSLCFTCHDNSSVQGYVYNTVYSYQGRALYNLTPHAGASPMPTLYTYNLNSNNTSAWESNNIPIPITSPGIPADPFSDILDASSNNAAHWITDFPGLADRDSNYQMFRFHVNQNVTDISKLKVTWTGYGEPTAGYPTSLFIRNFNSSAWESLASRDMTGEGTLFNTVSSNISNYLDANGDVYILVSAMHDATPPTITGGDAPRYNTTSPWCDMVYSTQEDVRSYVEYGPTTGYGTTVYSSTYRSHNVRLSDLTPGATYYYRITAIDVLDNKAIKTGSFTAKCGAPVPNPVANTSNSSPSVNMTFTWNAVSDLNSQPVKYDLQISTNSSFNTVDYSYSDLTSLSKNVTLSWPGDWGTAQPWYWRVRAKDSYGMISDWAVGNNFSTYYSCPILYTWDGTKYRYVTDIAAGSSLGLELAPDQFIKPLPQEGRAVIPTDYLAARDGRYTLKIKNDQNEIDYIDNVRLQAVDHPVGTQIALNDFVRGTESYSIYTFSKNLKRVKKAFYVNNPTYNGGNITSPVDIMEQVSNPDGNYAPAALFDDNQYTFDLGDLSKAKDIKLVITGWTEFGDPLEKEQRIQKSKDGRKMAPSLMEILQPDGSWKSQKIKHQPGYTKTSIIDLTGAFPANSKQYLVRLRGMMRPHIDFVGIDTSTQANIKVTSLNLLNASLNYRGSALFSKYPAPHFDYEKISLPPFIHEGNFTKYGNVLPLTEAVDDKLVVMDTGDELTLNFKALPPPAPGMVRSFVIIPWAYFKEVSFNNIKNNQPVTSEPLPFKDMPNFPYIKGTYPVALAQYIRDWNTRQHHANNQWEAPPVSKTQVQRKAAKTEQPTLFDKAIRLIDQLLEGLFDPASLDSPIDKVSKTTEKRSFTLEPHYSLNTNYIEVGVVATSDYPNGDCLTCHAVHGADSGNGSPYPKQLKMGTNTLCFGGGNGCHGDTNSVNKVNIMDRFTANASSTSHHSINPTEWTSGTGISCVNCHDPHLNTAEKKLIDPDNRFSFYNLNRNGINNYLSVSGEVYLLAEGKHDLAPPKIISGPTVSDLTATSAKINWTSDEDSTSYVDYASEVNYAVYGYNQTASVTSPAYAASHSVPISDLSPGVYHYRIRSKDALNNDYLSDVDGHDYTFRISNPPYAGTVTPIGTVTSTATQDVVTFQWSYPSGPKDPDGDPVTYTVEIFQNGSCSGTPYKQKAVTSETSWVVSLPFPGSSTWSWRLRATDSWGATADATDVFTLVKSSCPILYTWDGSKFQYNTDISSGGDVGLEQAPGKYLKAKPDEQVAIPYYWLKPKNGQYVIKIKDEQDEVEFIDNLVLEAVDHPAGTRIALNDFMRSQSPYKIYTFDEGVRPVKRATFTSKPTWTNHREVPPIDITGLVSKVDDKVARGNLWDDNQFTFDLGDVSKAKEVKLVLVGWTQFANAIERVQRVDKFKNGVKTAPSLLEVLQPDGTWKSEPIKHFAGYTKTVVLDLTGKFPKGTKQYKVRLRGMYRPYFDFVGVDTTAQAEIKVTTLDFTGANLKYSGPSLWNYSPPRYDYYTKRKYGKFVHPGKFTRFGDVAPLLKGIDDKFVVMDTGDELTVTFKALPPPAPGFVRSYVLKPWAYYKELSEAKVEPMPFRQMDLTKYPKSLGDYPDELKKYVAEWNTRVHHVNNQKTAPVKERNLWEKFTDILHSFIDLLSKRVSNLWTSAADIKARSVKVRQKMAAALKAEQANPMGKTASETNFVPEKHYSLNTDYVLLMLNSINDTQSLSSATGLAGTWEASGPDKPTPTVPGAPISASAAIRNSDSNFWTTDLASVNAQYNYQMFSFNTSLTAAALQNIALYWVGYGEPTAGHDVTLYLWNFKDSKWDLVNKQLLGNRGTITKAQNVDYNPFCLKCHDTGVNTGIALPATMYPSVVKRVAGSSITTYYGNDIHGSGSGKKFTSTSNVVPPYKWGNDQLPCADCHDPHGSSNAYHLREKLAGNNCTVSVPDISDNSKFEDFCQSCHAGDRNNYHSSCMSCHNDTEYHDGGAVPNRVKVPDFSTTCVDCHQHGKYVARHGSWGCEGDGHCATNENLPTF